ncbi:MAG: UDP-N-acetylmuramoyl-L-alanyl-D-glutamate--2,6-diaminopimelate ligase [Deltaproteobacteria bacterium]|nr:UDP-N-acetylmuramoyl-L-alanyl-D-glutamate--2,6-diaminopimelate ligase [Deltaproteobacteria bacterium]
MTTLRALVPADHVVAVHGSLDVAVAQLTTDSRSVGRGDVFVCLPGYRSEGGETRADRHDFIPAALAAGAAALVVERDVAPPPGVTMVRVADAWRTVAAMAAAFHGHPSRQLELVGITGTSGKTSTTYFVEAVLAAAGRRVARLGTIEYRIGDRVLAAAQTTPEAPLLHGLLRQAVDAGCTAAVMEVSSHALELRRVAELAFDVAVFTNLSHDHLNFHPDLEHYRRAKGRLFAELSSGGKRGTAVINVDDPHADYMLGVNRGELVTYGVTNPAMVRARDIDMGLGGVTFTASTPRGETPVRLRHLGAYSVYNALAALAVGAALDLPLDTIAAGLAAAPAVPGRFELIDAGQDFVVAVDYAHKPDALARLIESARAMRPRRVITLFGCGGDRDRAKRPLMGRISAAGSDLTVVTSDNPRSEDPAAIVEEILVGVREVDPQGQRHVVEVDRARAIALAIERAASGDIVLIAGKGHEPYQLIAGVKHDFDDRLVARGALRARRGC